MMEGNIGEDAIRFKTSALLRWKYNKIEHDYGLDALIELCENDKPTGRFVFAQVKNGKSYLIRETPDGYDLKIEDKHKKYWEASSLNVIVVFYDSDKDTAYWQQTNEKNISTRGKTCSIFIPRKNVYGDITKEQLSKLFVEDESIYYIDPKEQPVENFPHLVAFLDDTKASFENINMQMEKMRSDLNKLDNKIKSDSIRLDSLNMKSHSDMALSNSIKQSTYFAYSRFSSTFSSRINNESNIIQDSFNIGFYPYYISLMYLFENFGYEVENQYDLKIHKCLKDLLILSENAMYTYKIIREIEESANSNAVTNIREIKSSSIAVAKSMNKLANVVESISLKCKVAHSDLSQAVEKKRER